MVPYSSASASPVQSSSISKGQSHVPSYGLPDIIVPPSPTSHSSNGVASSVLPSVSSSADQLLNGLLPSSLKPAFAPTGVLPSSIIAGSTGSLPSVIVTPTQTPTSPTPSSPDWPSYQGPFIISGTGTGGASLPVVQPTTSHGLLHKVIQSLHNPVFAPTGVPPSSVIAPSGLLPSSVIEGSAGSLPSIIVTPTQASVYSSAPSLPDFSSFQGPFIISGTGTGGASLPIIQPTTSPGRLHKLIPSFHNLVMMPTGVRPSPMVPGSTGSLPSIIVTPTQASMDSSASSSADYSSFQGPFIISGTGTGGVSLPIIQPTASNGLLDELIPSLLRPLEPTRTPDVGSTGQLPLSPVLPTGSSRSRYGPQVHLPLPLPTGTGIMLGISAALDSDHSPLPTPIASASASTPSAISTSENVLALPDLSGKLSSVLSELPGIFGPPSLSPTTPTPTASPTPTSSSGDLLPALSSLLPSLPDLHSWLASGRPLDALPSALPDVVGGVESLLHTPLVPVSVPTALPSQLVPSRILPSLEAIPSEVRSFLGGAVPSGILPSLEAVPSEVRSFLGGAVPSSILPSFGVPTSGILPSSLAIPDILPSSIALPHVLPSSLAVSDILPSSLALPDILPSSIALPHILPSSLAISDILPTSILPTDILPSLAPLPTSVQPSSVAVPSGNSQSSVAYPSGNQPSPVAVPSGNSPSSLALPVSSQSSPVTSPSDVLPLGILPSSIALLSSAAPSSDASHLIGLPTGSLLPSIIPSSIPIPIPSETAGVIPSIISGLVSLLPSSAGISPSGAVVASGSVSVFISPAPTPSASQLLSVPASEGILSPHSSGAPAGATSTPPSPNYATISHVPTASIEDNKSPSTHIPIPVIPSTSGKPPLVISLSATATDSATSLVVGTSIVQEASSMPTPTASPTISGIPSSLPRMIAPPGGVPSQISQDTFMGQVCFKWPLNYPFVSANDGGMQIFHYLPKAIADGLGIPQSEVQNLGLKPLDTTQYQGFITTLALFTIPKDLQNKLAAQLRNPADVFWHNQDSTVNDLTSLINTACPLAAGTAPGQSNVPNGDADPATTSNGYGGDGGAMGGDIGASRKVNSTSAIVASGAVVGALAYGAAMFFVARRYRNKRMAHHRSSSVPSTSRMTYGSIPGGAAAWMHGARNGRMTPGSRGSQGSSASQGPSVRTQQISAPVMAENSLGWN